MADPQVAGAQRCSRLARGERLHPLHAQTSISDETLRILEQKLDEREILSLAGPLRG